MLTRTFVALAVLHPECVPGFRRLVLVLCSSRVDVRVERLEGSVWANHDDLHEVNDATSFSSNAVSRKVDTTTLFEGLQHWVCC